jgi:membrane-associated protease RseP (regulator of RpoE activity)
MPRRTAILIGATITVVAMVLLLLVLGHVQDLARNQPAPPTAAPPPPTSGFAAPPSHTPVVQAAAPPPPTSGLAAPIDYVRSRVTGGVGVMLSADPTVGLPRVQGVVPGSPAEKAGLLSGDYILQINDQPTAGLPLAQVVNTMRGVVGFDVTIIVKRAGTTNLTFIIPRSSWKTLSGTNNSVPLPPLGNP